jgi:SAM-dependent methyltransferase
MYANPRDIQSIDECFFYHTIELPRFGVQEGGWDLRGRFADYIGHVDLLDKRVLDVGTASGFLTFSSEDAGAREVVSFDLDSARRQHLLPFAHKPYYTNHEAWVKAQTTAFESWKKSYWLTHRLLGSNAKVFYGDVYELPPALGQFDVVILGAILEHLSDPIRALASVSRVAAHTIVVNTDYIEDDEPVARFNGHPDYVDSDYIFWTYSFKTYEYVFRMLGFEIVRIVKASFLGTRGGPDEKRPSFPRAAIVAERVT